MANVLAALKRYDAAAKELLPLLGGKPGPEEAFRLNMQLGMLYMDAGKPDLAAAALRDAVALRRDPLALVRLSRVQQQTGQTQEAAKTLQEAVALGANPDTLVELATLMSKLDNNAAASNISRQALSEPQSPEQHAQTLGMKATLLAENGDNAAAREALTEALKTPAPTNRACLRRLAKPAPVRLADYTAAVAAYTQAIAAGAGQETELALAEALVKDSQPERALGVYKALVDKTQNPQGIAWPGQPAFPTGPQRRSRRHLPRTGQVRAAATAAPGRTKLRLRQYGQQAVASLEAYAQTAVSQTEKAEALLALGSVYYASQRNAAKAYAAFTQAAPPGRWPAPGEAGRNRPGTRHGGRALRQGGPCGGAAQPSPGPR